VQAHARRATALSAIWRASKDARLDASLEVRRVVDRHLGKEALLRCFRWLQKGLCNTLIDEEFWVALSQRKKLRYQAFAVLSGEHLRGVFIKLGAVNARPDTICFLAAAPEVHIFFKVARSNQHWPRNGPVNIDGQAFNIPQDSMIGRGLSPHIVVLWQSVHGNCDAKPWDSHPLLRDGNDSACDQQGVDAHLSKRWENFAQFLPPHHWFAAHKGDVQWPVSSHQAQHATDQGFAAKIADLP